MLSSHGGALRRSPLKRAALVLAGAIAVLAGQPVPAAHADSVPFWVQRDIDDAKAAKASKARYAAKRHKVAKATRTADARPRKKLGGYAAATEPRRYKKTKTVRLAALGNTYMPSVAAAPKSVTGGGGGVRWVASAGCLNGQLAAVVRQVAANYGSVTVNSTCRSKQRNRAVGGAHRSKHLTGNAVDFRVRGNVRAVAAYLRSSGSVGGFKHYGGGLFHIDTGPRRTW